MWDKSTDSQLLSIGDGDRTEIPLLTCVPYDMQETIVFFEESAVLVSNKHLLLLGALCV